MQFTVAKRDLESALSVVAGPLATGGSDISTHYLFRETDRGVEVLTFGTRLFGSCPLVAKVGPGSDGKGAFTIEAKRLKAWLGAVGDAALEFTQDGGDVVAVAPKGSQTFQSLDPSKYPFWDKMLQAAESTAKVDASRVLAAVDYSRLFASDRESTEPHLCVSELSPLQKSTDDAGNPVEERLKGFFQSTNKMALSLVQVAGLEEATLRLHFKEAPKLVTYLSTFGTGEVEILEHERAYFFRRGDGAVFGCTRFLVNYPTFKISMDDEPHRVWTFSKDELEEAIQFLEAGAAWEDNRLRFQKGAGDNEVILSMASLTGKTTELSVNALSVADQSDIPELPSGGFAIDSAGIKKVLKWWSNDEVQVGVTVREVRGQKFGFMRFYAEREGDKFLTILAWLR